MKITDKKSAFKEFAKGHPELVISVKNGSATWQKLYEVYDIYDKHNLSYYHFYKKR